MEVRNGRNRPASSKQVRCIAALTRKVGEQPARQLSRDMFEFDCHVEMNLGQGNGRGPKYIRCFNAQQASDYIGALKERV